MSTWRKSSFSEGADSSCVEVAFVVGGVAVRDSKDASGPILDVPDASWRRFVDATDYSSLRK